MPHRNVTYRVGWAESSRPTSPTVGLQDSAHPTRIALRASKGGFLLALLLLPLGVRADEPLGVRAVAFSSDGKQLAAGTGEPKEHGSVTLWEVATGKPRWQHQEKDGVPGV